MSAVQSSYDGSSYLNTLPSPVLYNEVAGITLKGYLDGPNTCPTWHLPAENDTCKFGSTIGGIVGNLNNTLVVTLSYFQCMTTTNRNGSKRDVVGRCLLQTPFKAEHTAHRLPTNVSKLNTFMCKSFNRIEQLCGKCRNGFTLPVYSYSLKCINCTEYKFNWIRYLAVAFGPVTVFTILVSLLHITPTSSYLHGFIIFAHVMSSPPLLRSISNFIDENEKQNPFVIFNKIYFSLLGIWNMDFFRLVYEPFCIHPKLTVLQTLALDYITAVYPLLLVIVIYFLVKLHTRDCRLIVWIWKPFKYFHRIFMQKLNIRTSLIDSFATLFLLSTIKFQSITLDLLFPTTVSYIDGEQRSKMYLYMAGDVEYFGSVHMPYGILAIAFFVLTILGPIFLMFFYPCRCFQQCLNTFRCNFFSLRVFMDVFQGVYKNGTDNSKDFRYFSGCFFLLRMISVFLLMYTNFHLAFFLTGIVFLFFLFFMAIFHPQTSQTHYIMDSSYILYLGLMGTIVGSNIQLQVQSTKIQDGLLSDVIGFVGLILPFLHIIGIIIFWIAVKTKIAQKILFLFSTYNCYHFVISSKKFNLFHFASQS